ncbi:type VI secretion protein VasK, partial [Klebsiella pneumoniae]|nr:type VI secretion protein VasK [Klebsiella pneumoniae]MCS7349843.1 type VI secretion protein VasK [Klebsiella pneumoniae]MCS7363669.1 type VI secretion protein VasK [Klebsiella pneumoniae]MDV2725648.1 type VI secretion protein VasK [Klebsiella pneumoniae]MDW7450411.1 type VI secretion protein VasK [Klebsiella pneumoniae]
MKKILIKFSGVFFVVIITVILFLIYYLWGPSLGWMEPAEKFRVLCTIFAVPVFLSLLLVSRYSLVAFASRLRFFCKLNDKQNTRSNNSAHLKQVDISKKIINEVQQVLRHTYGHFWHSKVRILLMTGSVSDVEQLAPKLTRELWREDRGTVLLWGGDPATPADADWLAALRKLRRRAVDGMVWVTSALDGMPATENSATSGLTPDAMDSVSHALKLRYEALGWKLPLYVWSLLLWSSFFGHADQMVGLCT